MCNHFGSGRQWRSVGDAALQYAGQEALAAVICIDVPHGGDAANPRCIRLAWATGLILPNLALPAAPGHSAVRMGAVLVNVTLEEHLNVF